MRRIGKILLFTAVICILTVAFNLTVFAGNVAYGAATVNATSLNIRSTPDTSGDIVGSASENDVIVILEKTSATWYKINCQGAVGYVSSDYLKNVLTAENFNATGVVTGDSVRVRSGPSTSNKVLGTYNTGTSLRVIGINNGWYKITANGVTGYIRSDYMDIVKPVNTSYTEVSYNSSTGSAVVDFAMKYLGYRYVYGGESPSTGFDCSGFVQYVYKNNGYSLSRTASQQYKNNGTPVAKADLQPGDLVFFSSSGTGVTHVGLYIGDSQFIHASTSDTGVIISRLDSTYYTRVWYGARRIVTE